METARKIIIGAYQRKADSMKNPPCALFILSFFEKLDDVFVKLFDFVFELFVVLGFAPEEVCHDTDCGDLLRDCAEVSVQQGKRGRE
ncbi:MAG: hypothetical protein SNG49_08750 [Rikenellaceae bacterium]